MIEFNYNWRIFIGAGGQRWGSVVPAVSGGPDETVGLRLGPLFRLPDWNRWVTKLNRWGPKVLDN
jgi:hypothetical protein